MEVADASFCGIGFRSPDLHDSMQWRGRIRWQLAVAQRRHDGTLAIAKRRDDGALTLSHALTPICAGSAEPA